MRALLGVFSVLLFCAGQCRAEVSVRGYYRKNGTYVRPHKRTNPDGIKSNNWSFRGNSSPFGSDALPSSGPVMASRRTKTSEVDASDNDPGQDARDEADLERLVVARGLDFSEVEVVRSPSTGRITGYRSAGQLYAYSPPAAAEDEPEQPATRPVRRPYAPPEATDDEKAESLLWSAKTLIKKDQRLAAMEWLQRLIDRYPTSTQADEARLLYSKVLEEKPWIRNHLARRSSP